MQLFVWTAIYAKHTFQSDNSIHIQHQLAMGIAMRGSKQIQSFYSIYILCRKGAWDSEMGIQRPTINMSTI
jgi:hypothetical protein